MKFEEESKNSNEPWKHLSRVDDEIQSKITGLQPTGEIILHALLTIQEFIQILILLIYQIMKF